MLVERCLLTHSSSPIAGAVSVTRIGARYKLAARTQSIVGRSPGGSDRSTIGLWRSTWWTHGSWWPCHWGSHRSVHRCWRASRRTNCLHRTQIHVRHMIVQLWCHHSWATETKQVFRTIVSAAPSEEMMKLIHVHQNHVGR